MAWLRIDDRVRTHPKIAQAGPAAAWLWFCGVCYCREHLTDGFIPSAILSSLALNLPNPKRHASALVNAGLWHIADGGFRVHDFLDWNPSKAEVLSMRDKERDKKRTQRGTPWGHSEDATRERADASPRDRAGDAGLGSGLGSPLGIEVSEESARETAPVVVPVRSPRGTSLLDPHTHCDRAAIAACQRGICVPARLAQQWRQQFSADDQAAAAAIRACVDATLRSLPPGPVGDDPYDFWRAAWRTQNGTQAPAPSLNSKGNASAAAMARHLERRAARQEPA